MKNIHILPTDKPSRLHYFTANKAGYYLYPNNELVVPRNPNCINQNIYITSDKEIKEGDWILELKDNSVWTIQIQTNTDLSKYKKIILTTDQDLIKDGIQAIDDEFLEWFVKNPSCEEVEVDEERVLWEDSSITHYKWIPIIPKEEPKERLKKILGKKHPKQETLEDFIYFKFNNNNFFKWKIKEKIMVDIKLLAVNLK